MNTRLTLTLTVAVFCVACTEAPVDYRVKGAELLVPFKTNLKVALVEGMESGPIEAINACKVEAPRIAAGLSVDGVVMGRSSHKLRNPANATPDWLAPILRGFADGSKELMPVAMALDDGRMGYAEPIIVQPMCLTCHGENLQPEMVALLAESYPEDQATGFKAGDFRGVFWVEFPER
ncbi:MAG: DUF3365 domain-containing protein [Gammaproteobacteria bacterium]|nr:DUF3365 domain-containing protein [Gammaproteobacteria bacterium]MDH5620203.1 DUF3365 domain-containing protein [Gammaproteobacteria bacterium]